MSDSEPAGSRRSPDHVLGVFGRERLSEALSATHRAGFGPYTRVLDGQRSDSSAQLARAGLEIAEGPAPAPTDLVILVQAPGRVDRVAELFHQLGAELVAQARRSVARAADVPRTLLEPEIRIPQVLDQSSGQEA
jgi:hypothetical protein